MKIELLNLKGPTAAAMNDPTFCGPHFPPSIFKKLRISENLARYLLSYEIIHQILLNFYLE